MKVNKSQTQEVLDISAVTLNKYVDMGLPVSREEGKQSYEIDLKEAVAWYLEYKTRKLQQQIDQYESDNNVNYDEEYRKYKAERMRIEAHKEAGHLVTVEEANKALIGRLSQVRETLKNIPLSWPNRIIGLETQSDAQNVLSELLQDLFEQLANKPDQDLDLENGEDISDIEIPDIEEIKVEDIR